MLDFPELAVLGISPNTRFPTPNSRRFIFNHLPTIVLSFLAGMHDRLTASNLAKDRQRYQLYLHSHHKKDRVF